MTLSITHQESYSRGQLLLEDERVLLRNFDIKVGMHSDGEILVRPVTLLYETLLILLIVDDDLYTTRSGLDLFDLEPAGMVGPAIVNRL